MIPRLSPQPSRTDGDGSVSTDWDDLSPIWQRCFELGWESYREGSVPVGCVITEPHGNVVAEGRNRAFAADSTNPGLAGTYIAHAEINALAYLPPGDYPDHTIWSTLEPCFMCSAAVFHSHVGTVRYAAPDRLMDGVERLPELNEWVAGRWPERDGPHPGAFGAACELMHLAWSIERAPSGVMVRAYDQKNPELLLQAQRLVGEKILAGMTSEPASNVFAALAKENDDA